MLNQKVQDLLQLVAGQNQAILIREAIKLLL